MKLINGDKMLLDLRPITNEMENSVVRISDVSKMMRNWVNRQPEIDPVYIAGGCYCKECIYHEQEEYPDTPDSQWVVPVDEYFCNLNSVTMPLNGFCSEGKNETYLEEK